MNYQVYALALGANLCFALGSQAFAIYGRRLGSPWMNWFKASFALLAFVLYMSLTGTWQGIPLTGFWLLFASGFMGLGTGDIFLFKAFAEMGPGRTLMLFAFQPLLLGTAGYFLFDQQVDTQKFWAIFFFIVCLIIFSLEAFRKDGHWNMVGIGCALFGMCLDAGGVIITRQVFDDNPSFSPMEGNVYRCIGAICVFLLLKPFKKIELWKPFLGLNKRDRIFVIGGSFLGTFLSLSLYLNAIKYAHLASISGIAITGTIFSSFFECLIKKEWPSRYLIAAFASFFIGMKILLF